MASEWTLGRIQYWHDPSKYYFLNLYKFELKKNYEYVLFRSTRADGAGIGYKDVANPKQTILLRCQTKSQRKIHKSCRGSTF